MIRYHKINITILDILELKFITLTQPSSLASSHLPIQPSIFTRSVIIKLPGLGCGVFNVHRCNGDSATSTRAFDRLVSVCSQIGCSGLTKPLHY
ncbi:hypothetical protein BDV35DRAFT_276481 [Aspergillus flavus]|uniref:Uncharacterized protein n=1 Tax=Aspergillus flavus TaxID=5059 RepID=A0A5N6HE59_ASPFL|nr:hypothetical protein BDV35DRAFT_276481 [Aspergillus flavus]